MTQIRKTTEFMAKQLMGDDGITRTYEMYFSAYSKSDFDAALERRMNNIKEYTEIKQMEYNAITVFEDHLEFEFKCGLETEVQM